MCMWEAQDSRSALIQSHFCTPCIHSYNISTQKTSVGMYSGCDYPCIESCSCTFDPAIPTSSFNFIQLFLYLFLFFFISVSVIYQCHLTISWFAYSTLDGPSIEDGRC